MDNIHLGINADGTPAHLDLGETPHLLIYASTGAGKTEALLRIIDEVVTHCSPAEAQLILLDPKKVNFCDLADLPHLVAPIAWGADDGAAVLDEACRILRDRLSGAASQDAHLFVIVDELADLALGEGRDAISESITELVRDGAAAKVHLFAATQIVGGRPAQRIPYDLFDHRLVGRMWNEKDSKRALGSDAATTLHSGEMIYTDKAGQRRIRILRAGE